MANIYSKKEAYSIADTIWQQLGGQRFSLITGVKPVCYGEQDGKVYLLMHVGRNKNNINLFKVMYNAAKDLYEICFIRKRGIEAHTIAEYKDVYFDMLTTIFTQYTGLVTSLKVV